MAAAPHRWLAPLLLVFAAGCVPAHDGAVVAVPQPGPAPAPAPAPAPTSAPTSAPTAPRTAVPAARAERIVVDKSERTLTLFARGRPFRTYHALQFGGAPQGHKRFQGDERTPEGRYTIDARNPRSAYHLSLRISYPNAQDRAYARARGRSPGGDIFIHGQPNALRSGRVAGDWTDGCIALSNAEIEELWRLVPDGTPIDIVP